MAWRILFHDALLGELQTFPDDVRIELFAAVRLLQVFGPSLGRPHADTLSGSHFPNMKELRFRAGGGVWRVAYAFDPARRGIVLVAGDKAGVSEKRFYAGLIARADNRFAAVLKSLKEN